MMRVATYAWRNHFSSGSYYTEYMLHDLTPSRCAPHAETLLIHSGRDPGSHGGMVNTPVFRGSTILSTSLVSRIPHKVALEFLMLGDPLPAQRAYEVGLVNRVVPKGQAHATALEMAQRLADSAPLVLQTIKRATLETLPKSPAEIAYPQMGYLTEIVQSEDYREGVAAFKEKRKPVFAGR